jgi:hypothetical protein
MTLTLLFTIHKGLHDCVKEVKNLEQLKEREETEVAFVESDGIFSCFIADHGSKFRSRMTNFRTRD